MPRALRSAVIAAALLVVVATASGAGLRGAEPAPGATIARAPGELRVETAVPLTDAFVVLEARDARGRRVSGPATIAPDDPQALVAPLSARRAGGYSVRWRALGQDGAPLGGVYRFAVRTSAPPPPPVASPVRAAVAPLALARGLALVGPILMLGLVALRWWVLAPAARAGGIQPPTRGPARARPVDPAALGIGRWWRAWWAATAVAAIGAALAAGALLWALRSRDLAGLLGVRPGAALALELGAAVLAAALGLAACRRTSDSSAWAIALGVPPAVSLVAISAAGHAWVEPDRAVAVGADALHNVATAAWIGGLAGLIVALGAIAGRLDGRERTRLTAGVVVRFSTLAIGAVAVLVVTGTYRALAELDAPADLLDTRYGIALSVKLCVFAVLLATGGYNRLVLHPRLERAALGLRESEGGAIGALRVSVAAELALAIGVLAAVAVMVSVQPPA